MMQYQVTVHLPQDEAGSVTANVLAREDATEGERAVVATIENHFTKILHRVAQHLNLASGIPATLSRLTPDGESETLVSPRTTDPALLQKARDVLVVFSWIEKYGGHLGRIGNGKGGHRILIGLHFPAADLPPVEYSDLASAAAAIRKTKKDIEDLKGGGA